MRNIVLRLNLSMRNPASRVPTPLPAIQTRVAHRLIAVAVRVAGAILEQYAITEHHSRGKTPAKAWYPINSQGGVEVVFNQD